MADISQQITDIEKEIRETPYHKGTEHHIGKLRARLARLRDQESDTAAPGRRGSSKRGWAVKKQGDATVVLVGPPSVGKSTLLNSLTNAKSKIAPYAFTTVTVIPGMMNYRDAEIQILDVPGLIRGAEEGKGRGKEVLSVVRGSDLLVVISDIDNIKALAEIKKALYRNGIRINQNRPEVVIEKKLSGGIIIHSNIKQNLARETIKEVANEIGYKNAEITIKEKLDLDLLIDAFSRSRVFIPAIFVLNKVDVRPEQDASKLAAEEEVLLISAEKQLNLKEFKERVWQKLELVRVYLIRPNEEPNFEHPLIMKRGSTLEEIAESIGSEFAEGKTSAKIWGTQAKFPGQEVSLSTPVSENLQIRFI